MTPEEIKETLMMHELWLNGDTSGKRAELLGANLRKAELRKANLRNAELRKADLLYADWRGADLRGAWMARRPQQPQRN